MESTNYMPRISDVLLAEKLRHSGAVLITGPKWCGKTATASMAAESIVYMQDPDKTEAYMQAADTKPSLLLEGKVPRLIDEWQMAPVLWDAVRFAVDQRQKQGQFILTGSAVPVDNATQHTGTGRISRLRMRPMSLYESQESNGSVSLKKLFEKENIDPKPSELTIEKIAFAICRGGWPASVKMAPKDALEVSKDYVDAIIHQDVSRVDGVEKNPKRVQLLLRSLARNIATLATNKTIMQDIEGDETGITAPTLDIYMNALRRIFVIEDQPAWAPSMRSKTAIRSTSKRHFVDPSIATAVLRTSPSGLLNDFNTFGFLFESLCTRDLRIYAQANDGEIYHFRNRAGLEADIIIAHNDGRWAAVEAKLGTSISRKTAKTTPSRSATEPAKYRCISRPTKPAATPSPLIATT